MSIPVLVQVIKLKEQTMRSLTKRLIAGAGSAALAVGTHRNLICNVTSTATQRFCFDS